MAVIASVLFIAGYALIALEHRFNLSKAMTASALGGLLWLLIAAEGGAEEIAHALEGIGGEIFGLIAFLLAAMTLVELLIHYRFFDLIRSKLLALSLSDAKQLWLVGVIAFFLSSVIDNLTTTIVMVQIARRFFRGRNLLVAAAMIVIAANAGGAFSPIGDVTTIMLWLAHKFSASEVILWGFLPSVTLFGVSTYILGRRIVGDTKDETEEGIRHFSLSRSEGIVVGAIFSSFALPVVFHLIGLEPYLGLLFGLGVVGMLIALLRNGFSRRETHMSAEIETIVKRVDMSSILFFVGILLAVGALRHLGILTLVSEHLFGPSPEFMRLFFGNALLGVFSAIVDNIPITAAALDIITSTDPAVWVLLALAVGTGGSLLVIGSAAGVIAMGMIKELTFRRYFEIAFVPALVGYAAALLVWLLQYGLFR